MKKYLVLFQKSFIKTLAYRSEIGVWLLLDFIPTIVLLFMWQAIYRNQTSIGNYTLTEISYYYLISVFVEAISAAHFQAWRVEQIRNGKIDYFLIRPLSYIHEVILVHLGGKTVYCLLSLPFFAGVFMIVRSYFHLPFFSFVPSNILLFSVILGLSLIINTLVALIIVILGFWFEGADGLDHFREIIFTLFSGVMIPIRLMPSWLQYWVELLPFKYTFAVPIEVLLDKRSVTMIDFLSMSVFILFLSGTVWFLWQKAKIKYSSAGG